MPTFGSLFAGIGGIDLGLERAGWECRWQVEWDPYCQAVLRKHWPRVPRYGDITAVDWSGVERVDLLAGGFPCQPFSLAGKLRGKADERWLWPAFADAVRALRPRLVLVENVPGLLAGHGGMGAVLGDLAELGYDTQWDSVPAAAVGAPHLRYRVWIAAYAHGEVEPSGTFDAFARSGFVVPPDSDGIEYEVGSPTFWREAPTDLLADDDRGHGRASGQSSTETRAAGHALNGGPPDASDGTVAHASSNGRQPRWPSNAPEESGGREPHRGGVGSEHVGHPNGTPSDAYAEEGGPRRATGEPGWWATEPDVGRVAHGVPSRVDRLRALGNAVVPQVVEVIGRQLIASLEAVA